MVSRTKQTTFATDRPIRFYKFVALTFLCLTIVLFAVIVFMSSKRATITVTTKESPIDVEADMTVGAEQGENTIAATVTTTWITLEDVFSPTGNEQIPGIATGVVVLHNETDIAQALVATTRLLSPAPANILFRLKERVTIPAHGTIEAEAYADIEGAGGNIEPTRFTIPGLREEKQREIYAVSNKPMSGGTKTIGVLSQDDVDRARGVLLAEIEQEARERMAPSETHMDVLKIIHDEMVPSVSLGTEVSEFTLRATAQVASVFYSRQELKTWAEELLLRHAIDDTTIVRASTSEPSVTFVEYREATNEAVIHVFYDGTVTINPESKQLDKTIFFGKTKDEVRRYLLSLDHIEKVDLEFRPAWMHTVPHIHDHVSVVVKQVE